MKQTQIFITARCKRRQYCYPTVLK